MKKTLIVLTAIVLCASLLLWLFARRANAAAGRYQQAGSHPRARNQGNAGENAAEEEPIVDDDASDPPEDEDYADDPSGARCWCI